MRSGVKRIHSKMAWALVLSSLMVTGAPVVAQDAHRHTPPVSGMTHGVPYFCATPTIASVASGAWSNPSTWSTKTVPGANDKVAIAAGHTVTYDARSNVKIECIEV